MDIPLARCARADATGQNYYYFFLLQLSKEFIAMIDISYDSKK